MYQKGFLTLWLVLLVSEKLFAQPLYVYSENCKMGYKNDSGEVVIPAQFKYGGVFHGGFAFVTFDSLYGYINTKGNFISDLKFEEADYFNNNYAIVTYKGKTGLIDTNGNFVIDPLYFRLIGFNNVCYSFYVNDYEEFGLICPGNKVILKAGNWLIYNIKDQYYCYTSEESKWGISEVNDHFNIILKPQFDSIFNMSERGLIQVKKNAWGVVDTRGKTIVDFKYDHPDKIVISNNVIALFQADSSWIIVNRKGKKIFRQSFEYISDFCHPYFLLASEGKVKMIRDCKRPVFIDSFQYISLIKARLDVEYPEKINYYFFLNNHSLDESYYKTNQYFGLFDTNANLVLNPEYENIFFNSEFLGIIEKGGKYGFINRFARIIQPLIFDLYDINIEGKVWVGVADSNGENYRWGLLDEHGETLIRPVLPTILHDVGNAYILKKNGIYGLYSLEFDLLEKLYYRVIDYDDYFFYVYDTLTGKIGISDRTGRLLFGPVFDTVSKVAGSIAKVKKGGLWGIIDVEGNYLVKPEYKSLGDVPFCLNQFWKGIQSVTNYYEGYSFYQFPDTCLNPLTIKKNNQMISDALDYLTVNFVSVMDEEGSDTVKDVNEKYYALQLNELLSEKEGYYNSGYYLDKDLGLNYFNCNNGLISVTESDYYSEHHWFTVEYSIDNGILRGDSLIRFELTDVIFTNPEEIVDEETENEFNEEVAETDNYRNRIVLNNPEFEAMVREEYKKSLEESNNICIDDAHRIPFTDYFEFDEDGITFYLDDQYSRFNSDYSKLLITWDRLKPFLKKDCPVWELAE